MLYSFIFNAFKVVFLAFAVYLISFTYLGCALVFMFLFTDALIPILIFLIELE